ncbi:uncharacterized protein PAC_10009 [Phialocephala subalpina]|uniref:Transmembrane protein n=1 Tax=Phialocephala subalpina TaxID=576137 RepID=A0A1L7X526_9HELO|nr:uncharacterized protein PAC_10009 [Phialocephala subalpina]
MAQSSQGYSAVGGSHEVEQNSVFTTKQFSSRNRKSKGSFFSANLPLSDRYATVIKVFDHDRWRAVWGCVIHLPPVAVTAALLGLNFSIIFYGGAGGSSLDLRLNALQFAARFHEVLITVSLSIVALNYVQYELLHGEGLSLRGVLAGFQVTDLSSIWNPGLWKKSLTRGFRTRRFRFALLVLVLAILLSQANSQLEYSGVNTTMPLKITNYIDSIYDRFLLNQQADCQPYNSRVCYLSQSTVASVGNMLQELASLSSATEFNTGQNLHYAELRSNGSDWRNLMLHGMQLSFPISNGDNWTTDTTPLFNAWNKSNASTALWLEPPQIDHYRPSVAVAFAGISDTGEGTSPEDTIYIAACSLDCTWQPMDTYIVPSLDTYIHSSGNDNISERAATPGSSSPGTRSWSQDLSEAYINWTTAQGTHVQLDVDWANSALPMNEALVPMTIKLKTTTDQNPDATNAFTSASADTWPLSVANSLSLLVIDAMARIQSDVKIIVAVGYDPQDSAFLADQGTVTNIADVDRSNATEFHLTVLQNSYSYSMNDITRRLVVAVLVLHAFIALLHTAVAIGCGWTSRELKSLCDVVILALNSPPGKVTEDGEKEKQKNCTVRVQERDESHLKLVVGHDCNIPGRSADSAGSAESTGADENDGSRVNVEKRDKSSSSVL